MFNPRGSPSSFGSPRTAVVLLSLCCCWQPCALNPSLESCAPSWILQALLAETAVDAAKRVYLISLPL